MDRIKVGLSIAFSIGLLAVAGGSVAAENQVGDMSTPFTSSFTYVGQPELGTERVLTGKVRTTGETWQFRAVESSDRRLDGVLTFTLTEDVYPEATVFVRAARIVSDEGAWQEEPNWVVGENLVSGLTLDQVYVGEGDYEGLILLAEWTWTDGGFDLDGHIIESDLPTAPEPWSEE